MTYIPRLAIGPTRVDRALVEHILSERRRLGIDEGIVEVEPKQVFAGYCNRKVA